MFDSGPVNLFRNYEDSKQDGQVAYDAVQDTGYTSYPCKILKYFK